MALKNKYQREKQQYTNDSGRTWIDVSPANYRRGRLIEAGSEDCNTIEWKEVTGSWFCIGFNDIQYRWVTVSDEYVCVGYNKYEKLKKQQSSDGGTTWTDVVPLETQTGSLIEANSDDCSVSEQYLTFEALENSSFKISNNFDNSETILYSLDEGLNWNVLKFGSSTPIITSGNKILWKGRLSYVNDRGIGWFSSTGKFNIKGNIMSLLYGDDFIGKTEFPKNTPGEFPFSLLFVNTDVVDASKLVLPATTLTDFCYNHMFQNCESLVKAPRILPAMTLASSCYSGMFYGCRNLVTAPELPATILADYCYQNMFDTCKSLTTAPVLPATTLVDNCYSGMFYLCWNLNYIKAMFTTTPGDKYTDCWLCLANSTGTFVKNKDATWDVTGTSGIPTGWTVVTQ